MVSGQPKRIEPIVVAEWGRGEISGLLGSFLLKKQNVGVETDLLDAQMRALLDNRPVLFLNRARHGLALALQCCSELKPTRDEVIFPAYICPSVFKTIERCGLVPVAADVGEDLNISAADIRRRISSRTLAVVAAHMYGAPAQIQDIEKLCRANDLFLIDDAAQVVGVQVDGKPLGTFGTFGIVSFAQSKTIVGGGQRNAGGTLVVNDSHLEKSARQKWIELPAGKYDLQDIPDFMWHGTLRDHLTPWKYLRDGFIRRTKGSEHVDVHPPARRMANANTIVALEQLKSLSLRLEGRARVVNAFGSRLAGNRVTFPQYSRDRYLTRILLLVPTQTNMKCLAMRLSVAGIATRRAYSVPTPYATDCVRASDFSARLLEVPSHSRMSDSTVDSICHRLSDALQVE